MTTYKIIRMYFEGGKRIVKRGLTLEQAIACPSYGAPLVVIGAPLAIDADSFSQGAGNVEEVLRKICDAVHGFGDVKVKGEK